MTLRCWDDDCWKLTIYTRSVVQDRLTLCFTLAIEVDDETVWALPCLREGVPGFIVNEDNGS